MKLIDDIKATRQQRFKTPLDNGEYVELVVHYFPAIEKWSVDVFYKEFKAHGIRICNSFNILHQFSSNLPFGLLIDVKDGGEPFLINDFSSKRVQFFILSMSDVEQVKQFMSPRGSV